MSDIIEEVDRELREDRTKAFVQRYLPAFVAFCVAIVIAVGGLQVWRGQRQAEAEKAAAGFIAAVGKVETEIPAASVAALTLYAETAPDGYRTLALLRAAGVESAQGRVAESVSLYERVAADEQADPLYRELAVLQLVRRQIDDGDIATLRGRLAPLVATGKPFRPVAMELEALLAERTGDIKAARGLWQQLADDNTTPAELRRRAAAMLRALPEPRA